MKRIINILIINILIINLTFSQTSGAANQKSNSSVAVCGQITYAALGGLGSNGYIVPVTGNISFAKITPDLDRDIKISVYPNPTQGPVHLFFRTKTKIIQLKINLINSQGRKIKDYSDLVQIIGNTAHATFNLSNLANGVYFLNIKLNNSSTITFKLIKN